LAQPKNEFLRDAVIQRFEYLYGLAWKLLKRHLEADEGSENVDRLTRKDLYRVALEKGLIGSVEAWFEYHRARNQTSHAYDERTAEEVYDVARRFSPDARRLLAALDERSR
jgi:nucleotidyltransferase substrate binding protein (TIGR01987 family)